MKLDIHLYDDDGAEWDAYVGVHSCSTNYHRHGWRTVVEKSFGHSTHYLVAKDAGNEIVGLLPLVYMKSPLFGRFMVSLPFFNYGGVLSDNEEITGFLIREATRILNKLNGEFVELRHLAFVDGLETKRHKVTMILDLEKDEESQWRTLDAKVRNQVRKAQKNGLKTVCGGVDLLDGFYEVFCRNMRDLGTPVYSKVFFQNVFNTFPDCTRIISVTLEEKTVASGVLTWFRGCLEVPWASSVRDYKSLCPNNLLYWESIRFALGCGVETFDFGRSTPGEGTYRFKKQWGARPVPLYWQYLVEPGKVLPEMNPKNSNFHAAIKVWKMLPVVVSRTIGPRISRNIP